MFHLCELLIEVAAYTLRWRVGVCHVGMARFEVLQLVHERVKFEVGNVGTIEHIVFVVVLVQLLAQLYDALSFVHICRVIFFF